jgi:hypothetical protein
MQIHEFAQQSGLSEKTVRFYESIGILPPMPEFWMHQLDEEPALFFDPPRLKQTIQAIIDREKHE